METSDPVIRIQQHFEASAQLKFDAAPLLAPLVARGVDTLVAAVMAGGKVLACGNGGSAADCQHFAAEFVGRFERERPELAALALTTDSSILTAVGNDYSFDEIFAKQVRGLGRPGDVLIAISTSGNSKNVVAAINAAHQKDMRVIALTGRGGGAITGLMREEDVHVCVPHERTARIQEVHLLVLHCLCDGVDVALLGEES